MDSSEKAKVVADEMAKNIGNEYKGNQNRFIMQQTQRVGKY